jgi:DeoR family suf operon transcriptional repressor
VTAPEPALESVPSTRRAILTALKRRGSMRTSEVADVLGVTVAAARQQLVRLSDDGLVEHRSDVDGRGRPAHRWELAALAESLFPKRYGDLTAELLGYLGGSTSPAVTELFEQRRHRRAAAARPRLAGLSAGEQVTELARILDQDGYLAEAVADGDGWLIVEHNCAILTVAEGFRQACSSEVAFIRDVLPWATVERVSHRMDGAHRCAYRIQAA